MHRVERSHLSWQYLSLLADVGFLDSVNCEGKGRCVWKECGVLLDVEIRRRL